MSEATTAGPSEAPRPTTAGAMLRQARQAQGLHIAALAAAIKVVPRKLEWLESDQFDKLPDATFTRALAQTVCRTLKVDAAPVLALLPPLPGHRLEQVSQGLNTPFNERPGRVTPPEWSGVAMPALVLAGVLVLGAVVVYLLPAGWSPWAKGALARVASKATPAAATASGVTETITSAAPSVSSGTPMPPDAAASATGDLMPPPAVVDAAAATPVIAATGVLQLQPSEASWVEVTDAHGKSLIARLVQPGESVGLDGALPFKVKIGNASTTQVMFRGQPFDLGPFTRDNLAKFELK